MMELEAGKKSDVTMTRLPGGAPGHNIYDIVIHIPRSHLRRSRDGRTYLFASIDEKTNHKVHIDGLKQRIDLKVDMRIVLDDKKWRKVKHIRSIKAFEKNAPMLL